MAGNKNMKSAPKKTKSVNSVDMKKTFGKKIGGRVRPAIAKRRAALLAAAKEY
jgi:hypothetical protein